MKASKLIHEQAGTYIYIECPTLEFRVARASQAALTARRMDGEIRTEFVNGFFSSAQPVYLLKITVVKQGRARFKPGRKVSPKQE
jgi:hypothetical protein